MKRLMISLLLFLGLSLPTFSTSDFLLLDVDGNPHKLSDYEGRWVVLNFWATWCPPCLEEIPELAVFHEKFKEKVVVLGINYEDVEEDRLRAFMDDNLIDYPVLRLSPGNNAIAPIKGLPTTVVVSPEGDVHHVHVGAVTRKELEQYIRPGQVKKGKPH